MKVHVKNNRWQPGSFPNTPEGEAVFTISRERIDAALTEFPDLVGKVDYFIDWDTDNFTSSMADSDILLTWDLPTENLSSVAPRLRWIHCIGAGVEHLLPMTWLPEQVTLTNNKGVHGAKAGEFGLMAVLMLHTQHARSSIQSAQRSLRFPLLFTNCRENGGDTGNRHAWWLCGWKGKADWE